MTNTIYIRSLSLKIGKLWFLDGTESAELRNMYVEFIDSIVERTLDDICKESDFDNSDEQLRRCTYLITLFSYSYDDRLVFGICRYDYSFLCILIRAISGLIYKLIKENAVRPDNFCRLIYLLDRMISNWLDIFETIKDTQQYKRNFLDKLKNQLCLLVDQCKVRYRLVSLTLSTIVVNLIKLINLIENAHL